MEEKEIMNTKKINRHYFRNLCIGMCVACLFVLWAFNIEKVEQENIAQIVHVVDEKPFIEILSMPAPELPKPEPEQQKQMKTKPLIENALLSLVDDFRNLKPAPITRNMNRPPTPVMAFVPNPMLTAAVEMNPDILPQFPGGEKALKDYLEHHVQYPERCLDGDKSGIIAVRFIVDENGNISDAIVIKDELNCTAGYEAIRVMYGMPKWTPGKKNGQNVKSYFIQVFRFTTL